MSFRPVIVRARPGRADPMRAAPIVVRGIVQGLPGRPGPASAPDPAAVAALVDDRLAAVRLAGPNVPDLHTLYKDASR